MATALLCTAFLVVAPASGDEALQMRVSPAVSLAPAVLTVRVTIEPSADNRLLQIVAESPTYFRSSEVEVDGDRSAPLNVIQFRNLPTGVYHITGVLTGASGRRAVASRLARVESAPNRR